ncbi:hypothetical protein AMS68_003422 [Peltaster fructicola]|uniref:Uncharacterized protein n=1 Tax=Peltaster fructicola TaxID=286661 RepID=A0A6H0XTD3_9PEZI|nr:hypothetical protein AMS68_003422 [Peltaster fructicola]
MCILNAKGKSLFPSTVDHFSRGGVQVRQKSQLLARRIKLQSTSHIGCLTTVIEGPWHRATVDATVHSRANLNYQRAIDIARNTEGTLNAEVSAYLDQACSDISDRINAEPDTYILTKDEFAVFNFYRSRFGGAVAEAAVARYWRSG